MQKLYTASKLTKKPPPKKKKQVQVDFMGTMIFILMPPKCTFAV